MPFKPPCWSCSSAVWCAIGLCLLCYMTVKFTKEKGTVCKCKNRVKKKIIAITGANSGIGYEVALKLASFDSVLYICSRNKILGEAAVHSIIKKSGNPYVYFVTLDLSKFQSCLQCAQYLLQAETKLDILIHNAGVFHADSSLTEDGFELSYQTNFLGPVLLTEKLYTLLFESTAPRVIFLNSDAHKIPTFDSVVKINWRKPVLLSKFEEFIYHYGLSKLALKLYATHFADCNKGLGLKVASINPGNVWTPVYRNCWVHWYQWPQRLMCSLLMRSPKDGAQSVVHAANVEKLTTGSYIKDCQEDFTFSQKELDASTKLMKNVYEILKI